MTSPLVLQREDFGYIAHGRLVKVGLIPSEGWRSDFIPRFPISTDSVILESTSPRVHTCEDEREVELPPFLVVALREVYRVDRGTTWRVPHDWAPYWVRGAKMYHFDWQYPRAGWREATLCEIVCAIAQYPYLGSLRTSLPERLGLTDTIEACRWGNRVCLHKSERIMFGYQHHRLFVRLDSVPRCCTTRDLVEVR